MHIQQTDELLTDYSFEENFIAKNGIEEKSIY